ncbi:bifunctional riboflavin kinase/FMN adenylyltransferase [Verrucomicrobiota bacterium]
MKVIRRLDLMRKERRPVLLAAGFFDGMHRGHQQVIRQAVAEGKKGTGRAWVMTFDTHPMKVTRPEMAPSLLTSTPHKLHLLNSLGVQGCVVLHFTRTLARLEPESFIEMLVRSVPALHSLFVGQNWTFGRNGHGTSDILRPLAKAHGFRVNIIPPVCWKRKAISSTRIRRDIMAGKLAAAAHMLGRPVSIWGTVVRGNKIGTSLGFPTANLDPHNEVFPPDGVYAVQAVIGATPCPGIVNLGTRPTLGTRRKTCPTRSPARNVQYQGTTSPGSERKDRERVLELHLFNITQDLYRQDIEVFFLKKLRNERRFSSLQALKHRVEKDMVQAREWLQQHSGQEEVTAYRSMGVSGY